MLTFGVKIALVAVGILIVSLFIAKQVGWELGVRMYDNFFTSQIGSMDVLSLVLIFLFIIELALLSLLLLAKRV